jgi:hypothetical protein
MTPRWSFEPKKRNQHLSIRRRSVQSDAVVFTVEQARTRLGRRLDASYLHRL